MPSARPLGEVIDDLGVGSYQVLVVMFCSGLMLADGAMMLMISSIVGALDQEFQAGEITRGVLVSMSFGGMLVGNLMSGPLSSRHGRWWVCMASTLLLSFFGLVCSIVKTFPQLFVVQICLGLAIGVGGPASVTFLTEVTPTKQRGVISNSTGFAFMLGEVWTAAGLLLFMPDMKGPWRLLCIWGVLPALLVTPIGLLIHESPSWLQLRQRQQELRSVLVKIQHLHRKSEVSILVQPSSFSAISSCGAFKSLMHFQHYRTVTLSSSLAFITNYLFYGTTFAFTQIFAEVDGDWTSPAMEMLIIAMAEFAGLMLAWLLLLHPTMGRIGMLRLFNCLSFLFSAALVSVLLRNFLVADPAAYGLKAVVSGMFTIVYLYISEALPVEIRAVGVGFCMSVGRCGAVAAPAVFSIGQHVMGSASPFITSMMVLSALGFLAASHLVVETRDKPLDTPCLEMSIRSGRALSVDA